MVKTGRKTIIKKSLKDWMKLKHIRKVLIATVIAVLLSIYLFIYLGMVSDQNRKDLEALENYKTIVLDQKKHIQYLEYDRMVENATREKPAPTTLPLILASKPIVAGRIITRNMLSTKEITISEFPPDGLSDINSLVGRIATDDISQGEMITNAKLLSKQTKILSIPKGYQAMAIPLSNSAPLSGFLYPGRRIDILTILPESVNKENPNQVKISRVLLQNVKVLATRDNNQASDKNEILSITVAVPSNKLTELALALNSGEGNILIALRGVDDDNEITKTKTNTEELIAGGSIIKSAKKIKPGLNLPKPEVPGYVSDNDLDSILNTHKPLPQPEAPKPVVQRKSVEVIQSNSRHEIPFETEM